MAACAIAALFWVCVAGAASAEVGVGEQAPDFLLYGIGPASDAPATGDSERETAASPKKEQVYRLSEHVGERGVVLAFFPKAFTPG